VETESCAGDIFRQRLRDGEHLLSRSRGGTRGGSDRQRNLGRSGRPRAKNPPQSRLPSISNFRISLGFIDEAYAQEADINVSNPAIRALKDAIKKRSGFIKPYMDRGNVGINQDGLLAVRTTEGMNLKERAEVQQLVDAENRDREALYLEIAKANNIAKESVPRIKRIFAQSWTEQAQAGWWIQDAQGAWKKK